MGSRMLDQQLTIHPAAQIMPNMDEQEYLELREDICAHGQREPILITSTGAILDGRYRYRACLELNLEPKICIIDSTESPVEFVLSRNVHSLRWTTSQKAAIGVLVKQYLAEGAHQRQIAPLRIGNHQPYPFPVVDQEKGESRQRAAVLLGVSHTYISCAERIQGRDPDIFHGLINGQLSLRDAQRILGILPQATCQKAPAGKVHLRIRSQRGSTTIETLHSSKDVEWYTPDSILERVRNVLGQIDLDPASSAEANVKVQATQYFTSNDDGLSRPWSTNGHPSSIFVNPPFGKLNGRSQQALWTQHLIEEFEAGRVAQAILLVNAATGARWFQPLWRYTICFVSKRINFVHHSSRSGSRSNHASVLVYLGSRNTDFVEKMGDLGRMVMPPGGDGRAI